MKTLDNFLKLALAVILLLPCGVSSIKAQQDPQLTFHKYNMQVINPSYAGVEEGSVITSGIRSQWAGLEGAPETQFLAFSTRAFNEKLGVGISFANDSYFIVKETHVYADFSYKLKITENTDLYLGIKAGGNFLNVNLTDATLHDSRSDPLFAENYNKFNPRVGAGAMIKAEKWYFGLSSPTFLAGDRVENPENTTDAPISKASTRLHVFLNGGYDFIFGNFYVSPVAQTRLVIGAPITIDFALELGLKEIKVAPGVRVSGEGLSALSGQLLTDIGDWFELGYLYERSISELQAFNNGTHEILVKFKF